MKVVCAWCAQTLAPGEPGDPVSHGICPICTRLLGQQRLLPLTELLDQVDVPVVAFGPGLTALGANRAAGKLSPAAATKVDGGKVGDLIECPYALTPEGCGRSVHCSGCAILRMVADTQRDGVARQAHDVVQPVRRKGGAAVVRYCLSTQKVADTVLLIIEDQTLLESGGLLAIEPQGT